MTRTVKHELLKQPIPCKKFIKLKFLILSCSYEILYSMSIVYVRNLFDNTFIYPFRSCSSDIYLEIYRELYYKSKKLYEKKQSMKYIFST